MQSPSSNTITLPMGPNIIQGVGEGGRIIKETRDLQVMVNFR